MSLRFKGIIALQARNHPEIIPSLMKRLVEYFAVHPDINGQMSRVV